MRSPKDFFRRSPSGPRRRSREIPFRPSRMIHFFDPPQREDGGQGPDIVAHGRRPARQPRGRRPGRPQGGRPRRAGRGRQGTSTSARHPAAGPGSTRLDSPWVLDDLTTLVTEVGDRLDVDHGPEGRGRRGHPLRRPAARPARGQGRPHPADPRPRHPRDGPRRGQRRGDLPAPAPACRASRSARPTSPPTAG